MSESRIAIIAADGTFTYDQLDDASRRVAGALLADNADLNQTRVAFLVPPSFAYAAVQRGIWRAGGVAVPLADVASAGGARVRDSRFGCVGGRRRCRRPRPC